ncbi:MAG: lipid-A-disaccharide synthase [Bacillota bacterium]
MIVENRLTVFLSAGEASGDLLGAALAQELISRVPGIVLQGIGGAKMRAAGVDIIYDINDLALFGAVEVLAKLPLLLRIRKSLVQLFSKKPPAVFCGIDYPGLNVYLAGIAKKHKIKTLCYKAPSIWSWGEWRVKRVKKNVDFVAAIFPFEADAYLKHGVPAEYVGCPIVDNVNSYKIEADLHEKFALAKNVKIILLLPGSRRQEINNLLPVLVQAAELICEREKVQFVLPIASTICHSAVDKIIAKNKVNAKITVVPGDLAYSFMAIAHSGIAASGTVTLEAALLDLPLVIVYRMNAISYMLAKRLAKVDFIGLPNLVAKKNILPELIQGEASPQKIAQEISNWLVDASKYIHTKTELAAVREKLGTGGAVQRVANIIIALADNKGGRQ